MLQSNWTKVVFENKTVLCFLLLIDKNKTLIFTLDVVLKNIVLKTFPSPYHNEHTCVRYVLQNDIETVKSIFKTISSCGDDLVTQKWNSRYQYTIRVNMHEHKIMIYTC